MFVLLKGATKEQAFKIGNEIAEAVTATNPKPVKLKFEKVCEVVCFNKCTLFLFRSGALLSHIIAVFQFYDCLRSYVFG